MQETKPYFREVTDEEAKEYKKNGWVKLKSFVTPETANALFDRLISIMGEDLQNVRHPDAKRSGGKEEMWNTYTPLSVEGETGEVHDDLFYSLSHSPSLGKALTRLGGEKMRYSTDQPLIKMPKGQPGSGSTFWHVDVGASTTSGYSPPHGQMQVWIALRKVTPAHGTMRFVSPQNYNEKVAKIIAEHSVPDTYPLLEAEGAISEPYTLEIGDATVHGSEVWHSAPPNIENEPRWGYIVSTFPADRRFSGNPWWVTQQAKGMVPGELFPDARFPAFA